MTFLLKGLIIGFSIAAPVGPIGLLCIRRSIAGGRWIGFISGLGAATADAFYGAVAAFGVAAISTFLLEHAAGLRLVGGAFLLWLGVRTFLARPHMGETAHAGRGMAAAYATTLALTITNPMTILFFTAIFAAAGIGEPQGGWLAGGLMVLGVFCGSAAWWLFLSWLADRLRQRLALRHFHMVNRLSGSIILLFGLHQLWSVTLP